MWIPFFRAHALNNNKPRPSKYHIALTISLSIAFARNSKSIVFAITIFSINIEVNFICLHISLDRWKWLKRSKKQIAINIEHNTNSACLFLHTSQRKWQNEMKYCCENKVKTAKWWMKDECENCDSSLMSGRRIVAGGRAKREEEKQIWRKWNGEEWRRCKG